MERRGFAFVEIGIVVLILAALTAILLPHFQQSTHSAKLNRTTFRLQSIRTAIQKYKLEHGSAPESIATLVSTHDATKSPLLERIPREAFSQSAQVAVVEQDGPLVISDSGVGRVQAGGWIYNRRTGEVRVNLRLHRRL